MYVMDAIRRHSTRGLALGGLSAMLLMASCGDSIQARLGDDERVRGSGDVTREVRSVDGFDRLVLAGEGRVLFDSGSDGQIEIETDDNLHGHIQTEVVGQTLTIRTDADVDIDPTEGVVYRLGCPSVEAVDLTGAGTIELESCVAGDALAVLLAGAGSIVAPELDVEGLEVDLPGAGDISLAGDAARLDLTLSGAGDFRGADLRTEEADVEASGAGSVELWVEDRLAVTITGVGDVSYYGEPSVQQTVTGVGSIVALGAR